MDLSAQVPLCMGEGDNDVDLLLVLQDVHRAYMASARHLDHGEARVLAQSGHRQLRDRRLP